MKKKKKYHKKYKFTYIKTTVSTLFLCLLFLKGYIPFEETGENFFHVWVNGQEVGTLGEKNLAEELLIQARRNVASASDELVFMEANLSVMGEEVLWGEIDAEEDVLKRMEEVLESAVIETMHRSYTMKVNEYIVNLASVDEAQKLLQAAIDKYDSQGQFAVELAYDTEREFSVLATRVQDASLAADDEQQSFAGAGVQSFFDGLSGEQDAEVPEDFEDYDLGILTMDFSEKVEVVEAYLPESQLTSLEEAVNLVIMEQEAPAIYEVVAGDTLYEIALTVNIPIERIVEMNSDLLEDENTILQIGDQLYITVPEPQLSVTRVEQKYYEETYEADVVYIENDNWFTNQTKVHKQPSAGYRRVVANVSYVNDKEVGREILKEEIVQEAVAKVVERGTKIPPTYIKPLTGGRASSGFGPRSAPVKGASTYHKAQDWATPTGTSIYASCGGTVSRAGWGSGYGYVVYIDHPDGRQTRYAHLSKILVKVGQQVSQGERIALSGNTGITSGPHLHFELLINGVQVDPMKYINK